MFHDATEYCNSLYEDAKFSHDDNCWFPSLGCAALDRASKSAYDVLPPVFVVSKTMIDFGGSTRDVGSFISEHEAIDFMLHWTGNGDCLQLYRTDQLVGYVDLWSRCLAFVRVDDTPVRPSYSHVCDEDIPF